MGKKKDIIPIGTRIRRERVKKKITLDTMANETGLKKDVIKEIESGKMRPSVGTLLQISKVLGIDSGSLFKGQGEICQKKSQARSRAYTKRTDNYAYTPLATNVENKHLKAFKIVVGAQKHHGGVGFQHEGEEFVHVLEGQVEVKVGDHVNVLKKGDSLHFNSAVKHDLRNTGKIDAQLIVVVYAP